MTRLGLEPVAERRSRSGQILLEERTLRPVRVVDFRVHGHSAVPAFAMLEPKKKPRTQSWVYSLMAHLAGVMAVIAISLAPHVAEQKRPEEKVTLIAPPPESYALPIAKTISGGGGGGGDREKIAPPKGKLPKPAPQQIAPPQIVVRNEQPKLPVEPTVVAPQIRMSDSKAPNLGDPAAPSLPTLTASNGTGGGGGIGSGTGGGVGKGAGPGVGEGHGGGIGGGAYHVGGSVLAPRPIATPDPDYTPQAREAKLQGMCVLSLIVGADGVTRDIQVVKSLGMGLDQKAIDAVRHWTFKPATKDGVNVPVQITVQVSFKLY